MNMKRLLKILPLHSLLLLGMALVFSVPYRISLMVQPTWLAYILLTGILTVLFAGFLLPSCFERSRLKALWPGEVLVLFLAALPRIYWISKYPVESKYGDMLPLIQMACERFLSGEFPYAYYKVPWPLPLTFFPGLWVSYLPTAFSGIDPRWIGLLSTLGCVFLMLKSIRSYWQYGVILAFCLLPVFSFFTVNGHTQPFWLMLCAFAFCYIRGLHFFAALCLGLAFATRQTAVILFPFAVLGWWRELGFKQSIRPVFITGAVTGFICLPFFLIDPDAFLLEPLRHYEELAQAYRDGAGDPTRLLETFGFANLLHLVGASPLLGWGRLGVCLLGFIGCFRFARTPDDYIRWMAVTGLFFTLFTPIPWIYAYFPFWLLAFFTVGREADLRADRKYP